MECLHISRILSVSELSSVCVCVCACMHAHVCVSDVSGWISLKLCALYLPWSYSSAYTHEIMLSCCSRCHRIWPPSGWGKRSMEDDLGYCMLTRRILYNRVCGVLIDNYIVEFECQSVAMNGSHFTLFDNMFPLFVAEFPDYSCL